jgi:di/tricarboxylate transporter
MLSATVMMWSGLLTSEQALSAFTEKTVWLIVGALLMAQAVDKSGLGLRISLLFIAAVGKTALGLTYALMGADLVIAMAMPSTTAREGEHCYLRHVLLLHVTASQAIQETNSTPKASSPCGMLGMLCTLQHPNVLLTHFLLSTLCQVAFSCPSSEASALPLVPTQTTQSAQNCWERSS